jgi:hypothetical protein
MIDYLARAGASTMAQADRAWTALAARAMTPFEKLWLLWAARVLALIERSAACERWVTAQCDSCDRLVRADARLTLARAGRHPGASLEDDPSDIWAAAERVTSRASANPRGSRALQAALSSA